MIMKMTFSAVGLLVLLPHAAANEFLEGFLSPQLEQKHRLEQVQSTTTTTNDVYATAEEACLFDAQSVCVQGSTLPLFLPDFVDFTFNMIDPTPMIALDNLFQSLLPHIIAIDLNDENQELNGFSSQPHHRRLEEMHAVAAAAEPKYLYDCPRVHTCLLQANEQQGQVMTQAQELSNGFLYSSSSMSLLSNKCSRALSGLKQPNKSTADNIERSLYHHQNQEPHLIIMEPMLAGELVQSSNSLNTDGGMMVMMVDFLWFLTAVLLTCMVLCTLVSNRNLRSARRGGQNRSERRKLKRSILQQVYSDPKLKKQVEAAMGESIGDIPPFPVSSHRAFTKRQLKRRTRRVLTALIFFIMPFIVLDSKLVEGDDSCCYVALFMLSFVMVVVLARAYHRAQMMMHKIEDNDCTCCCCGGSATDVENGTVSQDQECCACCQGTGVCPPACQLCCTDENGNCDNCCGCCGKDKVECICVDPSNNGTYRAPRLDAPAVKDGDCCCCNASPDADPESLTVEQIGCLCCGGCGECSKECNTCCASDCDKDCCDNTGSCCEPKNEGTFKSSTREIIDGELMMVV